MYQVRDKPNLTVSPPQGVDNNLGNIMSTTTTTGFDISLVFTGNPQYFGGHHLPNFAIPVDGSITYNQLKAQMLDWQTTAHLDEELFSQAGSYELYENAVEDFFKGIPLQDMNSPAFTGLDAHPDLTDDNEEKIQDWYDTYDCVAVFTCEPL